MAGRRTEMNLEGFFFLIVLLTPVHCIGEDLHLPFLSQENLLPPLLTDAQLQIISRFHSASFVARTICGSVSSPETGSTDNQYTSYTTCTTAKCIQPTWMRVPPSMLGRRIVTTINGKKQVIVFTREDQRNDPADKDGV
uniref:Uncharacterized protein n=1 Tax=Magallana gigas TaxID=29159 RepID=A0A8W8P215_MAGGI